MKLEYLSVSSTAKETEARQDQELSWAHIASVQVWAPQPMIWTSFYNDCQILARENKILYYYYYYF